MWPSGLTGVPKRELKESNSVRVMLWDVPAP